MGRIFWVGHRLQRSQGPSGGGAHGVGEGAIEGSRAEAIHLVDVS